MASGSPSRDSPRDMTKSSLPDHDGANPEPGQNPADDADAHQDKPAADGRNPVQNADTAPRRAEAGDPEEASALPALGGQSDSDAKLAESSSAHLKTTDNLPSLSPNVAAFGKIPDAPSNVVGNHRTMPKRNTDQIRHPNQMPLVKMSTVTMASR